MKLLFDQNISYRIIKILPDKFVGSSHVKKEGLINAHDREIWEFAKKNEYTIVTQDSDFNDLNSLFGFPPKIIWIRTGNIKTIALLNILLEYYEELEEFINDNNYGCFEVLSILKK
jgi:predicted nuclease of predicted toxin-antitoxin system